MSPLKTNSLQYGFTLIEMIVSLGIFAMVSTTAIGALLSLVSANERLQGEQSAMTNLAFAFDSMTREMRTGYNYYCAERPNYAAGGSDAIFGSGNAHEALGETIKPCPGGRSQDLQGVSFYEGGDSITGAGVERILYFYDGTSDPKTIKRKVGNGAAQSIVSSGVTINNAEFRVTGPQKLDDGDSNPANDDKQQPTITIYVEASETTDPDKVYRLQTTVTQRILDL